MIKITEHHPESNLGFFYLLDDDDNLQGNDGFLTFGSVEYRNYITNIHPGVSFQDFARARYLTIEHVNKHDYPHYLLYPKYLWISYDKNTNRAHIF